MPNETEDLGVKSTDSAPPAKSDLMEGSSPSESSTHGDKASSQTLNEFLTDNVEEFKTASDVEDESQPATEEPKEKKLGSEDEPDKEKTEADGKEAVKEGEEKAEGEKEDAPAEDKGPIPYERFQEKVKEVETLKHSFEEVQPKVQNYDNITNFCQQNQITVEQFNGALEIQALLNTDPAKALERLKPLVEQLQGFTGDKLPDDLQAKVDTGKLELEDAREIASLRAKSQFGEKKVQFDRQAYERQAAKKFEQECNVAASSWETAKRTSDPDYRPKAKDTDPDGKWEMTRDKYLAMLNQTRKDAATGQVVYVNPINTPQEMTQLMEKAYAAVHSTFANRFNGGRKPTRKSLNSSGSSSRSSQQTIEGAETMRDAIQIGLAARNR